MFSPYEYWQFWRNTNDKDVVKFLKYFTEIKTENLDKIVKEEKDINDLKILLANEATKILHGEKASTESENTAKETFLMGGVGKNLPEIKIKKDQIKIGINILDLLADNKIVASKSEARRVVLSNGIRINDKIISDDKKIIKIIDFDEKEVVKISFGKKKHFLFKII
jgi:tyrosyl-tRNA synthetase